MRKIHFIIFILFCLPQQLFATPVSYSFSGSATVDDNDGILLESFPDIVDFSGSFTTDTAMEVDCGVDCVAYEVYDFNMLLNGYNVYGYSRSMSNLWWVFDEDGTESYLGYSTIDHDVPVDNISWSELYLHFNVSPGNTADFSTGSLDFLIVSDFSTDIKDMRFHGDITEFESAIPVPEPATALLLVFGAIGFAGISQRTKLKHLEVFLGNGKKAC